MPNAQTYTLPAITAGVSGEAAIRMLNAPIDATEDALNDLSSQISSLNTKSAVVRHNVPIASGVNAGHLVYFDAANSRFDKAIAELLPTPGNQGQSIESPKSRVEGMILSVDTSGTHGTMLLSGYWESTALAQTCLGTNPVAGTYYLSPTVAGTAVTDPGNHLRQAVMSYYGNEMFCLGVSYLAHDNHFHSSLLLPDSWVAAAGEITNATFKYDLSSQVGSASLGQLSPVTTAVFIGGVLKRVGAALTTGVDVAIVNNTLYVSTTTAPAAGTTTVFSHYPFAYGSPVVRSVQSADTSSLQVQNVNGVVTLYPNDFVSSDPQSSPLAVSGINGNVLSYTPVLSGLNAGAGTVVTMSPTGIATVSTTSIVGALLDAYSINHNGTLVVQQDELQCICFPVGRTCSFIMMVNIDQAVDGAVAYPWVMPYGQGGTLEIETRFIPEPTFGGTSEIVEGDTEALTASGTSGKFSLYKTASGIQVPSKGTLWASVTASAPSSAINLFRVGFVLGLE